MGCLARAGWSERRLWLRSLTVVPSRSTLYYASIRISTCTCDAHSVHEKARPAASEAATYLYLRLCYPSMFLL
jgi:hypothetical protein